MCKSRRVSPRHPFSNHHLAFLFNIMAPSIPGILHQYPCLSDATDAVFESGDLSSTKLVRLTCSTRPPLPSAKPALQVIFLPGLGDGLGTVPYVPALSQALGDAGWCLYVAVFIGKDRMTDDASFSEPSHTFRRRTKRTARARSSRTPMRLNASLSSSRLGVRGDRPRRAPLVDADTRGTPGKKKFVLWGHSTGCQQSMQYLISSLSRSAIDKVVLQAPGESS